MWPLKTVKCFKYLDSHVASDNKIDEEIAYRIQTASKSFGSLQKRLWSQRGITVTTKLKVYRVVVLTALLYSIETMTLHRRHIKKLTSFQLQHLRKLMNIKWEDRVPNTEVLRRAQMPSVESMVLSAQLRWAGHVVRMEDFKLPKILLYGELRDGTRSVGGQKLRYKDTLKRSLKRSNVAVENWEAVARDRKEWRKIVHQSIDVIESK